MKRRLVGPIGTRALLLEVLASTWRAAVRRVRHRSCGAWTRVLPSRCARCELVEEYRLQRLQYLHDVEPFTSPEELAAFHAGDYPHHRPHPPVTFQAFLLSGGWSAYRSTPPEPRPWLAQYIATLD